MYSDVASWLTTWWQSTEAVGGALKIPGSTITGRRSGDMSLTLLVEEQHKWRMPLHRHHRSTTLVDYCSPERNAPNRDYKRVISVIGLSVGRIAKRALLNLHHILQFIRVADPTIDTSPWLPKGHTLTYFPACYRAIHTIQRLLIYQKVAPNFLQNLRVFVSIQDKARTREACLLGYETGVWSCSGQPEWRQRSTVSSAPSSQLAVGL